MKAVLVCTVFVLLCYCTVHADDGLDEWQDQGEAESLLLPSLVRPERAAKSERKAENKNKKAKGENCKYVKGAWGECDPKTNLRTRSLTLKKGDQNSCEATKTIQKKCKKGKQNCQYDKGAWSACSPQGQMTRSDRLKAGSDASCEASRQVTRPCKNKPGANNNKNNNKGGSNGSGRRNRQ